MRTSRAQTAPRKIVVTYRVGMSESTGSPTWTLIFALPAAVAAAVAAVNGLSQLTRSAKARRTIEWINSTIDKDVDGDSRQHPLTELRTEQEARLIATYYVPWWRLLLFPVWVTAFGVLFTLAIRKGMPGADAIRGAEASFLFTLYFAWLFIGSYRERLRISDHYKTGILREPRIALWRMGNKLVGVALWCTIGTYLLGGGLASLIAVRYPILAVIGLSVGYVMLFSTIPYLRRYVQGWSVATKTGAKLLGNERFSLPRFVATTFVLPESKEDTNEEYYGSYPM